MVRTITSAKIYRRAAKFAASGRSATSFDAIFDSCRNHCGPAVARIAFDEFAIYLRPRLEDLKDRDMGFWLIENTQSKYVAMNNDFRRKKYKLRRAMGLDLMAEIAGER